MRTIPVAGPAASFLLSLLFLLLTLPCRPVHAGVPDPATSSYALSGNVAGCPFVFRSDGGHDALTLEITVRHTFGYVMPGELTSVTLSAASGPNVLCSCCPLRQEAFTDSGGIMRATFSRLGGRGTLTIHVTAGVSPFWSIPVEFTSPDLNGSCEAPPQSATTILDLALWAQGGTASDYNCDGQITVLDLAQWAGGLGVSCDPAGCP